MAATSYEEHAPPPALAAHVQCIWTYRGAASLTPQRIPPDGRPELILHKGVPYEEWHDDNGWAAQPRLLFAGQLTKPLLLRAPGQPEVLGVRFKPAGAWAFLGETLASATDRRLAMTDAPSFRDDEAVFAYVAQRIAAHPDLRDEAVERAVDAILANPDANLDALCATAGVNPRNLQRRFSTVVGVSTRTLKSLVRFRRVFDALHGATLSTWSAAAQAAGYFDHPQMARDFQRFLGCSASEFVAAGAGLATSLTELDLVVNLQGGAPSRR
jgi:AraC-like DNA-binding protein